MGIIPGNDELAHKVEELIAEQGFEVPLNAVFIMANGSALIVQYHWTNPGHPEKGFGVDTVFEHVVDQGPDLPMSVMFVDATAGRASVLVVSDNGGQWVH